MQLKAKLLPQSNNTLQGIANLFAIPCIQEIKQMFNFIKKYLKQKNANMIFYSFVDLKQNIIKKVMGIVENSHGFLITDITKKSIVNIAENQYIQNLFLVNGEMVQIKNIGLKKQHCVLQKEIQIRIIKNKIEIID